MRLRKPCKEHGVHYEAQHHRSDLNGEIIATWCAGGEFLPEDAANRMHSVLRIWNPDLNDYAIQQCAAEMFVALAADQVRDPE